MRKGPTIEAYQHEISQHQGLREDPKTFGVKGVKQKGSGVKMTLSSSKEILEVITLRIKYSQSEIIILNQ